MSVSFSSIVPVRSISLPSRLNPNSQKIESELNKLKTWKFSYAADQAASSSSPLGSESLLVGLSGLAELYNCIEEPVHSPLTQQALNHQQSRTLLEETLDGSVGLLDSCGNARDLLLTMKEHVQNLQSALRRRTRDSSSIDSNVHAYICFRKKAKKSIAKSLKDLKKMETNLGSMFHLLDLVHNVQIVLKLLRELSCVTISVFESLFVFLSMPVTSSKGHKWSLVSKLVAVRFSAAEKEQKIYNEVGSVDVALCSLHSHIRKSTDDAKTDVQVVQSRLDALDCSLTGLEAGLERLFRCLLQHRVSLLNLLTP